MMKKINISSQLIILFFTILLIASCAFSITTLSRIRDFAEREVYSRLSTYIYLINTNNHKNPDFPDMKVAYYIEDDTNNVRYASANIDKYITTDELNDLIKYIASENEGNKVSFLANGYFKHNKNRIYYVLTTNNKLEDYTIIFTDSLYTNNLVRSVSVEVILVYFLVVILGFFVIYLWSNNFVRRIRKLQNHIVNLPKNKYEVAYNDDSLDEIGELSKSIERMRLEIGHNEKTKQEMLQNLSHDFKTPIAVIKSYAEAQQDGMVDEESSKIIIAQAEILKKKVNRLLQYNSLEYLEKTKEFEDVDMKELISEVLQNYRYQTTLEFDLDLDDNVVFKGYRENLYTVVDNIIDNAKRYAKTKIKIVLKPNRLRIYNDGEPIDEQFLNSVFKPYEKGSKGEFGLGMSIVKKTIDFFGMNLKVVNEAEGGVSFIIISE